MFADPLSNLMLVILLFFIGLLVMFVFIMRNLHLAAQSIEETRKQLGISLMDLERKLSDISCALKMPGEQGEKCAPPASHSTVVQPPAGNLENLSDIFDNLPSQDVSKGSSSPESDKK